jgi:hypothetical protein
MKCPAKADLASNCVRIIMSGKLTGSSCLRVFIYFILIVVRSELWSVWMRMMQARLFVECCRAFFLTLWMQAEPRAILRLQVTNRLATLNLQTEAEAFGIHKDRLLFQGKLKDYYQHVEELGTCRLMMDAPLCDSAPSYLIVSHELSQV